MEKDTMEKDLRVPEITQKIQIEESFYMDDFLHSDVKKSCEVSTMDEVNNYETEGIAVINVISNEPQCTTSATTSSATFDIDKEFPKPQNKWSSFMDETFVLHSNIKGSSGIKTMDDLDNYESEGLPIINVVPEELQCKPSTSARSTNFDRDKKSPNESDANNGAVSSSDRKIETPVDVMSQTYLKVLKDAVSSLDGLQLIDADCDGSDSEELERYKEFSEMLSEATKEMKKGLFQYSNEIFLETKRLEYLYNIVPVKEKLSKIKNWIRYIPSLEEQEEGPLKVVKKTTAKNSMNTKLPRKKVLPQYKRKEQTK